MFGLQIDFWRGCGSKFLLAFALSGTALFGQANGPDMSNVTDVLQGDRKLLQVDDLVAVASHYDNSNKAVVASAYYLPTQNSTIQPNPQPIPDFQFYSSPVRGSFASAFGRFYAAPRQQSLLFYAPNDSSWAVSVNDQGQPGGTERGFDAIKGTPFPYRQRVLVGDFLGTGFDQVFLLYLEQDGPFYWYIGRIAMPWDRNYIDAGFQFGPPIVLEEGFGSDPPVAIGNFLGTGTKQIALLQADQITVSFYTVDPTTLALNKVTSAKIAQASSPATLVAGRFTDPLHDDVVVAGTTPKNAKGVYLQPIQVIPNLQNKTFSVKVVGDPQELAATDDDVKTMLGSAASFADPTSGIDQLALIANQSRLMLLIANADETLTFQLLSENRPLGTNRCAYSMQIGNFDRLDQNGQADPSVPYIATFENNNSGCDVKSDRSPTVQIYPVKPNQNVGSNNSWVTDPASRIDIPRTDDMEGLTLAAGDLKGRSLYLGDPEKIVIQGSVQPDVVLDIPPMHADWIDPVDDRLGCSPGPACLVNLTVRPTAIAPTKGFATSFLFSSASSTTNTKTSTTSWSIGVKFSSETTLSVGDPDVEGISFGLKVSASYKHDSKVQKTFNTYQSVRNDVSETTGFRDRVFYTSVRHNIYSYPVLGQAACPATLPNCTPDQKKPVYVQYSVPDQVVNGTAEAHQLDWYQPIHEPGNIFSYPSTSQQVTDAYNGKLLSLSSSQAIGTGSTSYSINWTEQTGKSITTATANSFSAGLGFSYASKIGDIFMVGEKLSLDVEGSGAFKKLNVSTQQLDSTEGVTVDLPGFTSTVSDCCYYGFSGYIAGMQPFSAPDQTLNTKADLNDRGPLFATFSADISSNATGWWQKVYPIPDVGFTHPMRWSWDGTNVSFNPRDPKKAPEDDPFYLMKGFFITSVNGNGTILGPPIGEARPGDPLNLTARVYNFSTADTPGNATIYVSFFGQVLENKTLQGESFYIGSQVIPKISGYQTSGDPNWALATVQFYNTGDYAGKQLAFWVLTFMVDPQGAVLPEMPAHGVNANPSGIKYTSITSFPAEEYSNNVGLWGISDPLYIRPVTALGAPQGAQGGSLNIEQITASQVQVPPGVPARLRVKVAALNGPVSAGTLSFYHGPPGKANMPFATQSISGVAPGVPFTGTALYEPKCCGDREVYVVAKGAGTQQSVAHTTINVTSNSLGAANAH